MDTSAKGMCDESFSVLCDISQTKIKSLCCRIGLWRVWDFAFTQNIGHLWVTFADIFWRLWQLFSIDVSAILVKLWNRSAGETLAKKPKGNNAAVGAYQLSLVGGFLTKEASRTEQKDAASDATSMKIP